MSTSLILILWTLKTQSTPFCTSIILSSHITRTHYDNIIINNGHCYHRRTLCGWCKFHYELRIATSLYPYFIFFLNCFFVTDSHSFLYILVLNVCTLTPWLMTLSYFLTKHAIKHYHKLTDNPPLTIIAAADNHPLPINHEWINRKMSCIKTLGQK